MASDLGTVACPRCEGTGQKLNWYDPPKQLNVYGTDKLIESNKKRFSLSGREILDGICPICLGRGKLTKMYDGSVMKF